jgi:hypothetical protein
MDLPHAGPTNQWDHCTHPAGHLHSLGTPLTYACKTLHTGRACIHGQQWSLAPCTPGMQMRCRAHACRRPARTVHAARRQLPVRVCRRAGRLMTARALSLPQSPQLADQRATPTQQAILTASKLHLAHWTLLLPAGRCCPVGAPSLLLRAPDPTKRCGARAASMATPRADRGGRGRQALEQGAREQTRRRSGRPGRGERGAGYVVPGPIILACGFNFDPLLGLGKASFCP